MYIKSCNFLLYIDDLKIFITLNDKNALSLLQQDLNNVNNCSKPNGLGFNLAKCASILYSKSKTSNFTELFIDNNKIENVQVIKDLGIIFQKCFKFDKHIE